MNPCEIPRFLDLPDEPQRRARHAAFIERTSNGALKQAVCVSCAREVFAHGGGSRKLASMPGLFLLQPHKPHAEHKLWRGALLLTELIKEPEGDAEGWFCSECLDWLEGKKKTPPLSLANGMWIGAIPPELSCLTVPEQMLITQHYPRCFVYKLQPRERGGADPNTLQSGMRGNVSTYNLNIEDVAKMVDGLLLPQRPEILASIIAVTFVGKGKLPLSWLKSTFRVRRAYVRRALQWLIRNNPYYKDIQLSEANLSTLPEDDVPDVILGTVRQEDDVEAALKEADSYVPAEEDVEWVNESESALNQNQSESHIKDSQV